MSSTFLHTDGTTILQSAADGVNEDMAMAAIKAAWGCTVERFSKLSPIDCYLKKHERIVAVAELRTRRNARERYPTVIMQVSKWTSMLWTATGLGCDAMYIVQFTDGVFWIPLDEIDARQNRVFTRFDRSRGRETYEPVIDIPVASLRSL